MFPAYNCGTCDARLKLERGCEQDSPFPRWSDQNGIDRLRCPRRSIYEHPGRYLHAFKAYSDYQDGFLPEAGGMNDQAALFPEIMFVLKAANGYVDDWKQAQAEAESKRMMQMPGKK